MVVGFLLVGVGAANTGCGLIFNGPTQTLRVTSTPSGAQATFAGQQVTTPGTVTVRRGTKRAILRATKAGYSPGCQIAEAPINVRFLVLDTFPYAVPFFIDMAASTLREYPDELHVTLRPADPGSGSPELPSDADILRAWSANNRDLCLAPELQGAAPAVASTPERSVDQRLRTLEHLYDAGRITRPEYEERRAEVLRDL